MNDWTALDRFLRTDPHDVGCEQAMELLDVYVDWWPPTSGRRPSAIPASPPTWLPAGRARRISLVCSLPWSARPTDRRPADSITEQKDRRDG